MEKRNGMELVRSDDRLLKTVQNGITPFLSSAMRSTGVNATMFLRCAAQQLEGVDFDPRSLGAALVTFAMAGILPNKAIGHGYLIPYKKKGIGIVTPVFGYKGLIELGMRATPANGAVLTSKRFDVVMEGEDFDKTSGRDLACYNHFGGTNRNPRSREDMERLQYAYAQFTYAIAVGGLIHVYHETELMGAGDVLASRAMSRAERGPWIDWPMRMAQRVPVRRLCSSGRIPLGLYPGAALAAEGAAEVGKFSDYLKQLSSGAQSDRDDQALRPILDAGFESAHDAGGDEPDVERSIDAYDAVAAPIRAAMLDEENPKALTQMYAGCKQAWAEHGPDTPFSDEIAAKRMTDQGLRADGSEYG